MTDIDDLEGYALDEAVAREVMPWPVFEGPRTDDREYPNACPVDPAPGVKVFRRKGGTGVSWYPHRDIAAAWEVVERGRLEGLRQDGWDDGRPEAKPPVWVAHLSVSESPDAIVCRAYGDTAPLAICRAALKAVRD